LAGEEAQDGVKVYRFDGSSWTFDHAFGSYRIVRLTCPTEKRCLAALSQVTGKEAVSTWETSH
jgi:hypothetical protein